MQPRLILDISTTDLLSIAAPMISEPEGFGAFRFSGDALVCLSARSGFHALLHTLALPAHAPIIYSAITIETMVAIAQEHGLTPHFVDVDPATLLPTHAALDEQLASTGAKVVVIAQLYGCVSSLQALGVVCKKHGAILVEDCAQAFSDNFHLGDAAADFSLFSFGPIKRFTALGGGVIVANSVENTVANNAALPSGQHAATLQAIEALLATWPRKSDAWFLQRALKFAALKIASIPLIYTMLLRCLSIMGKNADAFIGSIARGFSAGRITPQLVFRPSPRQQRLLNRRLAHASHSNERANSAQQSLAKAQACSPHTPLVTLGDAADKNAYWLMPVLVADPPALILQLRKHGLDATRGATSMRAFGSATTCPHAHRIMQQVVYLPL